MSSAPEARDSVELILLYHFPLYVNITIRNLVLLKSVFYSLPDHIYLTLLVLMATFQTADTGVTSNVWKKLTDIFDDKLN